VSVVTIVWSMIAAACLTLAAVHLPVWWQDRQEHKSLAFSVAAICTAVIAYCELSALHARTPQAYAAAVRAAHIPVTVLLISLVAFILLYLQTGRLVLGISGIALRVFSTPFNYLSGDTLNFREIQSLRSIEFLGDPVSIPVGVMNPWMLLSDVGLVLVIAFLIDATLSVWRRGRRGIPLWVGFSVTLFVTAGLGQTVLRHWGGFQAPLTLSPFFLGVIGVMGYAMFRDLVNAKRLVAELRESEAQAASAAAAANLGTFTRDIRNDEIVASDKWRELFGFLRTEPLSRDGVMQRLHPNDRVTFESGFASATSWAGEYHGEYRLLLPDGRMRWILHHGRVECDARGRPARTRGASIDITAHKRAEQEMLRLRQDIAHVGRVSVMGQLASALAHEINQPLGAILRNAEAAALFIKQPSPDLEEISAIVDDIRKDDQRASEVIDRMRALLRRQPVEMIPLDLQQVLVDVATLLRSDAAVRHVKLDVDIGDRLPKVLGDRVQLQQVLLNLIINGMDALEGVPSEDRSVRVTASRKDPHDAEICVSDTGHGIPLDEIERIFDPFVSTKPQGIGMGLSISRSIVEAHSGRLWAENNDGGRGASFRFTVPVAA
jgi:two-component system, LuxR family, sensor kinase FixL